MASPYTRQSTFVEGSTTDPGKVNEEFDAIKGALDQMEAGLALADQWANEAEDVVVSGGEYSAKHYALKSSVSATSASASASSAGTSESNSASSKVAAEAAQTECEDLLVQCQSAASDAVDESMPGVIIRTVSKSHNSASVIGTKINDFAFSDTGTRILAAANTGKLAYSDTEGVFWTACTHGFGTSNIVGVVKLASGDWYAMSSTGRLESSSDGITFSLSTTLSIGTATALASSSDKLCAVGSTSIAAKVEGGSFSTFSPGFSCTKAEGAEVNDYSSPEDYKSTVFVVGGLEGLYEVKYESSAWAGRTLNHKFGTGESASAIALRKTENIGVTRATEGITHNIKSLYGYVCGDAGGMAYISECLDPDYLALTPGTASSCASFYSAEDLSSAPYSLSNAISSGTDFNVSRFLIGVGDKIYYSWQSGPAYQGQYFSLEGSSILTSELSAMASANGLILLGSSTGTDAIEVLRYDA